MRVDRGAKIRTKVGNDLRPAITRPSTPLHLLQRGASPGGNESWLWRRSICTNGSKQVVMILMLALLCSIHLSVWFKMDYWRSAATTLMRRRPQQNATRSQRLNCYTQTL